MEDVEVDCMEGGRQVSIARDIFTIVIIIVITCSIIANITKNINNTKLIVSIINMKFRRIAPK